MMSYLSSSLVKEADSSRDAEALLDKADTAAAQGLGLLNTMLGNHIFVQVRGWRAFLALQNFFQSPWST